MTCNAKLRQNWGYCPDPKNLRNMTLNFYFIEQYLSLQYDCKESWSHFLIKKCTLNKSVGLPWFICEISLKLETSCHIKRDAEKLGHAFIISRLNYFYFIIIRLL